MQGREAVHRFHPSRFHGPFRAPERPSLGRRNRPVAGIDEAVPLASEALFDRRDAAGRPLILASLSEGLTKKTEEKIIRGILSETAKDPD